MTFRDAIHEMLAGLELGSDPAEVLAEHGYDDVSPEAFSSALTHFAERAPLDLADALAPIVTRVSPVPFEEGDLAALPEADALLSNGGDVFTLLSEVGLAEVESLPEDFTDVIDADPGDFDLDAVEGVVERVDLSESIDELADSTFGEGGDDDAPLVENLEPAQLDEVLDVLDVLDGDVNVDDIQSTVGDALESGPFSDLGDRVDDRLDDDDADPSDLDLD